MELVIPKLQLTRLAGSNCTLMESDDEDFDNNATKRNEKALLLCSRGSIAFV